MGFAMQPVTLKNISFKNRIVRSATNTAMGNEDGSISDNEMLMYEKLSKNNIGLIITGHCYVNPQGQTKLQQTSMYHLKNMNRLLELTEIVHKNGSKIFAQLSHGGANVIVPKNPVAPSEIPTPLRRIAKALELSEIDRIVEDFAKAAVLAKKSGFDGVQIHAAHGFLLCQFLSFGTNFREDGYGGSAENRVRIVTRIIKRIKNICGSRYPVFVKLNSNCAVHDRDYKENLLVYFESIQKAGADAIELSGYDFAMRRADEHCYFLKEAEMLKKRFSIPVILVGGIRDFTDMERALSAGINMVSMARPFIAEPDLITRLLEGEKRSKCTSCSQCFGLYLKSGRRCILNPPGTV